jgi:hypothetical protein
LVWPVAEQGTPELIPDEGQRDSDQHGRQITATEAPRGAIDCGCRAK